jgi:hypothetical protein
MRALLTTAFALVLLSAPLVASADPPQLEARVSALGPVREGEAPVYEQLARALEAAETSASEGDSARAERHRDLALALVRSLEARRRVSELRARIAEREVSLRAARERLDRARSAAAQAATDQARVEATR